MQFPRTAALLVSAAIIFLLPVSSQPTSHAVRHIYTSHHPSWQEFFVNLLERTTIRKTDGVPELEDGEKPAQDPQNIDDKPGPQSKPSPSQQQNAPVPGGGSGQKPLQNDDAGVAPEPSAELVTDPKPPPVSGPTITPEVPGVDGMTGPEAAFTVNPSPPQGKQSVQPNSQELLGDSPSQGKPGGTASIGASAHSPSPSNLQSTSISGKPSPKATKSSAPAPSSSSSLPDTNSGATGSDSGEPVSPSSNSSGETHSDDTPDDTDDPIVEDQTAVSSTPSVLPKSPPPAVPGPTILPSSSMSASLSPKPDALEEDNILSSPEAAQGPSTTDSSDLSPSSGNETTGNAAVTAIPPPGTTAVPPPGSDNPPSGSTTAPVASSTPNAVETAIVPPPSTTTDPSQPSPSSVNVLPSQAPQPADVTAIPPPPPSETDGAAVPPTPASQPDVTAVVPPPQISPSSGSVPSSAPETPSEPPSGSDFTCLYFGDGIISGFEKPDPTLLSGETGIYSVPPRLFPGLAPQYLSHIFGKSWSYDAWVDAGLTYDFILGFAEIYDVACNAGPTAAFRKFEVIIGSESTIIDIVAEAGCGKALKKTFTGVVAESNFITASFQGFGQQAILNTMCYRPTSSIIPSPTPQASSVPESSTPAAENIVGPDENFKCINFGPKVVGGYTPYDKTAVQGNAFIYSGSGPASDDLPAAYRYHVFGQDWSYDLDVSSDSPQKVVLGFAEVYPKACDSGSQGAFRVFTASVGSDLELVDVMKTSGCGVVEQVEFENVAPQGGRIDISLSSVSGDSMLSVVCFAIADSLSPSQSVPTAIPPPTSPSLSPAPPGPSTPDASTYDACFKFGDEVVDGFTNVKLGSGIEIYTNPFAVVTGTPYDKVYGTHVFGTEFTFSVEADPSATKKSFILGFSEVFQPACKEGYRVFDVSAGPSSKTIDVYKEVGCNAAFDLRFDGVEPSSVSGRFEISFSSENNFAMLSAVCILDESVSQNSVIVPSSVPVTTSGTTGNDGNIGPELNAQVYPGAPNSPSGDKPVVSGSLEEISEESSPPEVTSPKPTQAWTSTNDNLATSPEGSTVEPSYGADPSEIEEPPSSTGPQESEEEAKPSPTASISPKNSPLPKEDGVIVSLPDVDTTPEPTEILIDLGLTSESNGTVPSPDPSVELVETDFSQTTLGADGETQSPQASPTVTMKPDEPTSVEKPPGISPSANIEPTMTTSNPTPVSPSTSSSIEISPSQTEEIETSQGLLEEDSSDEAPTDAASQDEVMVTSTPIVTAISPNDTQGGGSQDGFASQLLQEEDGFSGEPESSLLPDVDDGSNANGESPDSPLVTFAPPDTALQPSTASIPTAVVSSPDAPNNAVNGDSTESNQGVIIVVNSPIPSASPVEMIPSAVAQSPIPSAVPASPADLLPPVDNTPGPSVISSPSSVPQGQEPVPTVTPIPTALESLAPSGDEDSPVGVAPDSNLTDDGQATPSPSTSLIISTTGTDEVITVTTEAPSLDPVESTAEVAPAEPVYDSPDNGTGNIEVTDGSGASDENVKPDANEVIVAGEFKELISPQSEGKGFTIGMGVLGALLVLLLLVCLFFAIFRSGGGAYSYSSQYSGRKPTDYGDGDPSQGGYTEELAPGTGDYGNTYSYGQGAQDGYADGQGTFESRPQTNDESFAYEGAGDPLLAGSGYGSEPAPGPVNEAEGSTYDQTEPDTFQDYTSLNMQQPTPEHSEAQAPQNEDYTFTDTFTIQNNGIYSAETRAREIAQMQKTELAGAIASERSAQGLSQSSAMREGDSVTEGVQRTTGEYSAAEEDITEQEVETAQRSDAGGSAGDDGLSINSNPETVPSPYESNFAPQEEGKQSGKLDSSRWRKGTSTRGSRWIRHRSETLREEHVTETEGNLLRNDYSDSGPGVPEAVGERWGTDLAPASGVDESRVSNDGPWPAWWSRGKHLDPNLHADLAYEQEPAAPGGVEEDGTDTFEDDGTKENGASNAQGDESTFQQRSQMFSQEESDTFRSPSRPAPLAASSRPNVIPVASHIVPDSGWRRGPLKKLETIDENTTVNLDFEELRRRREPYVKSVASRLSVGLHSISTSMSKESAVGDTGEEYEGSQHPGNGTGTGATSWIGQTPVVI